MVRTTMSPTLIIVAAAKEHSRRTFLTGVAAGAGVAGLAGILPAPASAATPATRRAAVGPVHRLIESDRRGFNRRWFAPNLQRVFVPTAVDEVEGIVEAALTEHGRNVKVTSGRHCYLDFVYNDGTEAIIDLSALNQVGYDEEKKAFFVDAGCENWTVYRTLLNGYGRTLPAGSCYSVGAGGHIAGGGYGLLSRLHGLTIDHLSATRHRHLECGVEPGEDAPCVGSQHRSARARSLLGPARRGRRELPGHRAPLLRRPDPPRAPQHAALATLAWDWADMTVERSTVLLAEYADLVAGLPRTDFTLLKLNHVSNGQLGMMLQMAAPTGMTRREHERAAERRATSVRARFGALARGVPLRRPLGEHPGFMNSLPDRENEVRLTYVEALQTLNGSGPNQFDSYKSAYMKKAFPADQAEAIHRWLHVTPNGLAPEQMAQSSLQVYSYGGGVNEDSPRATAVPQRSSIMKLRYQTYWDNGSEPGQSRTAPYQDRSRRAAGTSLT